MTLDFSLAQRVQSVGTCIARKAPVLTRLALLYFAPRAASVRAVQDSVATWCIFYTVCIQHCADLRWGLMR